MSLDTLQEILEFAMDKEDASYRLYHEAAEKAGSISGKKMFQEMAEEEAGHKRLIAKLDREVIARYTFPHVPDLKIGDYLHEVTYRPDMTFQEILIFAMKEEERACRLYLQAETMTGDPDLKEMLLMLANEEKRHKFKLEALYDDKVLTEG
jgi:rubrerythrin